MAKFSTKITGGNLAAKFDFITPALYQEMAKVMSDFGEVAADKSRERLRAREYARYQDDRMNTTMPAAGNPRGTGSLGDSIQYRLYGFSEVVEANIQAEASVGRYPKGRLVLELYSDHPAAKIVEEGGVVHHPGVNGKLVAFSGYGYVPYAVWRGPSGRIKDGKFNVGDYSHKVGGGYGYQFGYTMSQLALTPLGQAVYAWKVKPHDIEIEAKHYMRNTLREMQPRFHDMVRGAMRKAFNIKAPDASTIRPGLVKGPGNSVPTNTYSSGNI